MTNQTDPAYMRQVELEIEMSGLGRARFRSKVAKDIEGERGASTKTGKTLSQNCLIPLSAAIETYVTDAYSGKPGRRAVAAKLIKEMDPDVISYLTTRAVISRLMYRKQATLMALAKVVATAIENEARFSQFANAAPGLYATIDRNLTKDGSSEHHRKLVLTYAMGKFDIPWDRWAKTDALQLGMRMVELMAESTPWVELVQGHESADRDAPRDQYIVQFTEAAAGFITDDLLNGEELHPYHLPTLIPPKRWTSLTGGGYHTNAVRPLQLVRGMHPGQRRALETAHLGTVYGALNAIQETAWRVNRRVLAVMEELARLPSEIAGLVSSKDLDPPDRPPDIDTNPETLKKWKWAARDVHVANLKLRQERATQQQLLDIAAKFREEPTIYFPHNLDFRGRVYPVPQTLHPQGSDQVKALLHFAEGKPFGDDGERWLAIHGANCYGVDKVSFEKRIAWVREHNHFILSCADDPFTYQWWTEADSPWCFLAFCFEWAAREEEGFVSHIPVALDGSCNGLQHFSAMLRDEVGGAAVNLMKCDEPRDIYQTVANRVMELLRQHPFASATVPEHARWAHEFLHLGIDRKVTKRPVMVLPYGGTPRSCLKYVDEAIQAKVANGHNFGDELGKAIAWLSGIVWQSIGDVVIAAKDAMEWLQKASRVPSKLNQPLTWTTPSGFVAHQACWKMKVARIETKIGGKITKPRHYAETKEINPAKQATSVSPNFVHSMDASAMVLTVDRLASEGVRFFAMIHDSYGTHAADASLLAAVLREEFIRMYEAEPLEHFRDEIAALVGPELALTIQPLPKKGTLNLWSIREADFFFA